VTDDERDEFRRVADDLRLVADRLDAELDAGRRRPLVRLARAAVAAHRVAGRLVGHVARLARGAAGAN
jgi:hypothetical protein